MRSIRKSRSSDPVPEPRKRLDRSYRELQFSNMELDEELSSQAVNTLHDLQNSTVSLSEL